MKSFLRFLLAMAALSALGCANSQGKEQDADDAGDGTDTDTGTGSDTDTGTDTGTNTDTDTDTGTDECQCFDATHACCQEDGCTLEPEGTLCDEKYDAEYSCQSDDPDCGSAIFVRYKQRFCDGESFVCFGEISDWGEWEEFDVCDSFEKCSEGEDDAGESEVTCQSDVENCPVGFDQRVCFPGATMEDCPETGCEPPLPAMTVAQTFLSVADGDYGEVVLLEIFTSKRNEFYDSDTYMYVEGKPFTDIHVTIRHGDKVHSFYNNYMSDQVTDYTTWTEAWVFHEAWNLPDFWGEDMSGTWELDFEDSDYSGNAGEPIPFELTEWCLTFYDPAATGVDTSESKSWAFTFPETTFYSSTDFQPGVIYQGTSYFEGQVTEYYSFDGDIPMLQLFIEHEDPPSMSIDFVAADGLTIPVKAMGSNTIPRVVELTELAGKWASGRYQVRIESTSPNGFYYGENVNHLSQFIVSAGVPIETDAGVDAGDAG